ncbi:MAG TPA: DUF2188 domain-containing protein [Acidimicrobiia bacterium]|jgi:hypothetical protein
MATARWDVTKIDDGWVTRDQNGDVRAHGSTRDTATRNTADAANAEDNDVVVRYHDEDGHIEEERLYPRRGDEDDDASVLRS